MMGTYSEAINQAGDAGNGKAVYQRACASCHRRGNSDGKDVAQQG